MSSTFVRNEILEFLEDNTPSETVIDLTAEYLELSDMIAGAGLGPTDPWLGVQFVGSEEIMVDIGATNTRGKYRESGVIYLHVVAMASLGIHNAILARSETIRNAFRGRRIGDLIIIESVSPANFGSGATLSFSGGYTAAVIQIDYQRDLDL